MADPGIKPDIYDVRAFSKFILAAFSASNASGNKISDRPLEPTIRTFFFCAAAEIFDDRRI
jgi:hypothetical protein